VLHQFRRLFYAVAMPPWIRRAAAGLYACAVDQARSPVFYERGGVPDTLDGRFDMVVLHVWLLLVRLRESGVNRILQRALQEAAVADYDRSLREMGVGDLSVGRRVREMARAQAGRLQAYDAALGDDAALQETLIRNIWRGQSPGAAQVRGLAKEVRRQHLYLENWDRSALEAGRAGFLPPQFDE